MRLPNFSAARVLVAGDVMLDKTWSGATHRISPEAPVPVVHVQAETARPGGAANVALNIAALGASASVLGVVGHDANAELLRAALHAQGVNTQLLAGSAPTITKLRVMAKHQQLLRVDFEESLALAIPPADLAQHFASALAGQRAVVLSDYGKGTLSEVAQLIAAAGPLPTLIDPKGSHWQPYAGATLITPNLAELRAVVGPCSGDAQIVAAAQKLRAQLGITALLVTRSEDGMTLITDGAPLHLPTQAREVFDVTGAGDTVIATLAAALAAGSTLPDACRIANAAAGVVVGKLGTATVSPTELRAALHPAPSKGGVLSEAELIATVAARHAKGERVVMTNGCFDVLHIGHLRYLQAARELGDALVVAVNTDASVQTLKGPSRPLNACADRMELLAGLACVDYVVPFAEATPQRLIAAVLPQVLVKGGDYTVAQIAGASEVLAAGGQVEVLKFYEGYSTTGLIQRAQTPQ